MKSSDDYKSDNNFALLLLGRAGSGKTSLSLRFPKPYILDCDNNLSGPKNFLKDVKFLYDTVNVDDDGNEVPRLKRLERASKLLNEAVNSPDVETIIVDSTTTFHDYIIDEARRRANLSKDDNLRVQDWNAVLMLWKHTIVSLRTAGKKLIFTGHTSIEKNELDGTVFQQVRIQGQMKDQLASLFSDCWRCQVDSKLDSNRKMVGEYKVRVLQDSQFLDLKTSLTLPSIFSADKPEIFLDQLK